MPVYRKNEIFESLPWTKKVRRSLGFCCPPGAFNNILSQIQVDITIPTGPGFPLCRCYSFLRPASRADGISVPQPTSVKMSWVTKTYCSEEFRGLHPQAMEKSKGVQPLWSSHRYLYCTHLLINQVTSVSPPKSHFATKKNIILKCAVTISVFSRSFSQDSPFQGCPQNAPPDCWWPALTACSREAALLTWLTHYPLSTPQIFVGFGRGFFPPIDCIQP